MWIVVAVGLLAAAGITLALHRRRSTPAIPATRRQRTRVEPQL